MKPVTVKRLAGVVLVPLAFEVLPHLGEATDCRGGVEYNLCSANEDPWALKPRDIHTPHRELETDIGGGQVWVPSGGRMSSLTTGPTYRMTVPGEDVAR